MFTEEHKLLNLSAGHTNTVMCRGTIIYFCMVATSFLHFSKVFTIDFFFLSNKFRFTFFNPPFLLSFFFVKKYIFFSLVVNTEPLFFYVMRIWQNIRCFYLFCPRGVWINWRQILSLTLFVWAVISTRTWGWEACSLAPMALVLRAKHEPNVKSQPDQQRAPHLDRSDALQNKALNAFWSLISTWILYDYFKIFK